MLEIFAQLADILAAAIALVTFLIWVRNRK